MSDTNLNPGAGPEQARTLERTANVKTQVVAFDVGGAAGPEKLVDEANPMPVSSAALGSTEDAAATTDTGTFSLIALIKRALGFWSSLASVVRATDSQYTIGHQGVFVLAKRRDSDSTMVADGDYSGFNLDETGRLKVASQPATYSDITGDITAVQATIGTPVAGGTVTGDVSRASNIMAFCTGTFAGVNDTFEGSLEATGETNWFGIQAVRSNANTIETATGALSAAPAYAWEMSVNALKRVRVRCTARTSGTQSWRFVQGTYATEPIPAAQVSATQPVSGTITANQGTLITPTPSNISSAANTNLTSVKTSAGTVYNLVASNSGASAAYVKLYNKASAPVLASDVPVLVIKIDAGATLPVKFGAVGHRFATGIALAITGGAADADATAVAAAQVKVLTSYV